MNLSQAEIDQMLGITSKKEDELEAPAEGTVENSTKPQRVAMGEMIVDDEFDREKYSLTDDEKDILGEIGNMCMGAVATTMYTLLDHPVSITTPRVSVHTTREVLSVYQVPFVIVEVMYTSGVEGKNILLLQEPDAALITDLLLGGDGNVSEPIELSELHMSAVSEIMNQMIGASANALSQIIQGPVDISTPSSDRISENGDVSAHLNESDVVIKICFDMEIEGLLSSQLLQLMPYELGRDLAAKMMAIMMGESTPEPSPVYDVTPEPTPAPIPTPVPQPEVPAATPVQPPQYAAPVPQQPYGAPYDPQYAPPPQYGAPPMYQQPYPQYPQQYPQYQQPQYAPQNNKPESNAPPVDIKAMNYQSFDVGSALSPAPQAFNMVHDIPLKVSVELGRTTKKISEILDFSTGTVIVLEKTVGDPVEIMANGKLIARGEVVAIEENYGVRITDIFT